MKKKSLLFMLLFVFAVLNCDNTGVKEKDSDSRQPVSSERAGKVRPRGSSGSGVTIYGTDGADKVWGTAGNDLLVGYGGDDDMRGYDGDDTIYGGAGNDHLYGHRGNDKLFGGSGNDYIYGGDGDDYIKSGPGEDDIDGGSGDDYIISSGSGFICGKKGNDTMEITSGNHVWLYPGIGKDILLFHNVYSRQHATIRFDKGNDKIVLACTSESTSIRTRSIDFFELLGSSDVRNYLKRLYVWTAFDSSKIEITRGYDETRNIIYFYVRHKTKDISYFVIAIYDDLWVHGPQIVEERPY